MGNTATNVQAGKPNIKGRSTSPHWGLPCRQIQKMH